MGFFMSDSFVLPVPYPSKGLLKFLFRAPLWIYRLGWGDAMLLTPFMALTTVGRNTGMIRHSIVEFRRHGSKYYLVSGWGERPNWVQNTHAHPIVTVQHGAAPQRFKAVRVSDPAEAVRVVHLFHRDSYLYDRLLGAMTQQEKVDWMTLKLVAQQFTVFRLERDTTQTPENNGVEPSLQGVNALMAMVGVLGLVWILWRVVYPHLHHTEE